MHEYIANLHIHTHYSDGHASHEELARIALQTDIDILIVTDHNVWVNGAEGFYEDGERRVLVLVGEEIHDQGRDPQKSHLLVFGTRQELAQLAYDPQRLLDSVADAGGLTFLAHPYDPEAPAVNEPDISWVDWDVHGYTGIELWNGFSEFKTLLKTKLHAIYYAYNPSLVARGPLPEALQKWDELLGRGLHVVAIGGSDAHAIPARLGPLHRIVFPYDYHFRAVNTHILIPEQLNADLTRASRLVLEAFRQGHAFIGYDLPAPTRGFRFTAHGMDKIAQIGDTIPSQHGVTFQIRLPQRTECRLLKDGKVVRTWHKRENCTYITTEPGAYRVEVYIYFKGRRRGWIFSNPIYVQEK